MNPRLESAKTVLKVIKNSAYSNIELSNSLKSGDWNAKDKSLYSAIVRTVLERKLTLDYIISDFVKKTPELTLLSVLYTGIVQVLYMDKIPDSAACDETVKVTAELCGGFSKRFVNGVMRNICRNKDRIRLLVSKAEDTVKYSLHPSICRLIREQYKENADEIMASTFSRPCLCLRTNTLKIQPDSLSALLEKNGIETKTDGTRITVFNSQEKVIGLVDEGLFFIQGGNSQYAVELLDAKPETVTVDVCACPGGKTLGCAISMENKGEIYAFDLHKNKLSLIDGSASKLGIDIIKTFQNDSRNTVEDLKNKADRVICDVPCSSLGVLSSKPEIRYKDVSDLSSLYKTQSEILCAASEYLRKGGQMVYSTCTVNINENRMIVDGFLAAHDGFYLVSDRQFVMSDGGYDGFYAALIRRKE